MIDDSSSSSSESEAEDLFLTDSDDSSSESEPEDSEDTLKKKHGKRVHVLVDSLLEGQQYVTPQISRITSVVAGDRARWLMAEPLWEALQGDRYPQCPQCMPSEPITVRSARRTDSVRDYEGSIIMVELDRNLRWANEAVFIHPDVAPQLEAINTANHGYVTLCWARTYRCEHPEPLQALPGDAIRHLMSLFCRVQYPDHSVVDDPPAVSVRHPHNYSQRTDYIVCLRVPRMAEYHTPQYEIDDLPSRIRDFPFPPKTMRQIICHQDVFFVPRGCPNSPTEKAEWQVSFWLADEELALSLDPLHRTPLALVLRDREEMYGSGKRPAFPPLPIWTVTFRLMEKQRAYVWDGAKKGSEMLAQAMERGLRIPRLHPYFVENIDVEKGYTKEQRKELIAELKAFCNDRLPKLLWRCCQEQEPDLALMGDEFLGDDEMRLRVARLMVRRAVSDTVRYRPTAPCWRHWDACFDATPQRLAADHRLRRFLFTQTGRSRQRCFLFLAFHAAPYSKVPDRQLSKDGVHYFWSATPLLSLLTESDMQDLLGDPAAVAAWVRRQLCRPSAERPAGLTAELNTPQGRKELLLQPDLLLQAFSEAVPKMRVQWQRLDQETAERWQVCFPPLLSLEDCRRELEALRSADLETRLRERLPELKERKVAPTASLWKRRLQEAVDGLEERYTALTILPATIISALPTDPRDTMLADQRKAPTADQRKASLADHREAPQDKSTEESSQSSDHDQHPEEQQEQQQEEEKQEDEDKQQEEDQDMEEEEDEEKQETYTIPKGGHSYVGDRHEMKLRHAWEWEDMKRRHNWELAVMEQRHAEERITEKTSYRLEWMALLKRVFTMYTKPSDMLAEHYRDFRPKHPGDTWWPR